MELRIYLYNKPVSDVRALRTEVFLEELGCENEFDDIDNSATHVLFYDKNTAIATGRLYTQGEDFFIGKVCVKKDYRGNKLGRRVVLALEEDARKSGGRLVRAYASGEAKPFCEKLGYTAESEADGAQTVMVKKLRD